jgi:hypothetical protein
VRTDDLRELRVLVTVPAAELAKLEGVTSIALVVHDIDSGLETARTTQFQKHAGSNGSRP